MSQKPESNQIGVGQGDNEDAPEEMSLEVSAEQDTVVKQNDQSLTVVA